MEESCPAICEQLHLTIRSFQIVKMTMYYYVNKVFFYISYRMGMDNETVSISILYYCW
jgi:hypothetical protein